MMATYDGVNIFGRTVSVQMVQNPSAVQLNTFFGFNGVLSLWGGSRGRSFLVTGILYGVDATDLSSVRALMNSYDDGIGRDFFDGLDTWPMVVFKGMEPTDRIYQGHGGLCLPYRAMLEGRI